MLTLKNILFNRPLFIALMSFFTLGIVSLLVYCTAFMPQEPKVEDMTIYPLDRPTIQFPLEINVAEGDFNEAQQKILLNVASTWKSKTNGVADIKFNMNWKAPMPFSEINYIDYDKYTIWLRDSSDPEILRLQLTTSLNADGISKGKMIVVMNDFDSVKQDNNKLYTIVMHELSHTVGMEHTRLSYPGLFNVNGNDGVITENDLIVFCSRYTCKK